MKQLRTIMVLYGLVLFASASAMAQESKSSFSKKQIPAGGYWVVESNMQTPRMNTIYFYDDNDSLIYREKIEGRRVNIKRKATVKKLNSMLGNLLFAANKTDKRKQDESLVERTVEIEKK